MANTKTMEYFLGRIGESLPPGLNILREDLEKNLRSMISAAVSRANLVTRDEFDLQSAVLARTREKLESLEVRVAELEQQVRQSSGSDDAEKSS
ncbi:MAG: accessory factor UbiK family protein [Gammaproteobacteria bacterium]|nr:accessory factor UbiK family protein [Gammaproteobacteria bacterium]